MKSLILAVTAATCLASVSLAQAKQDPRVLACDPQSALLNSPTIFDVGRATVVKACPSFEKGATNFLVANLDSLRKLTGEQAILWMLHGPLVTPPKDTVIVPPVPVDTVKPPKDSTPVTPPPVDTATTWTFCVNAGNMCQFLGTRVVRLANANASQVATLTATRTIPCANYGFNANLSGSLHCDFGPVKTIVLAVPMAMGPIQTPTIAVYVGSKGSSTMDIQNGGGNGVRTDGSGSFRTTCDLVKYAFIDPIVYPGDSTKSHLHAFFGNVNITASTDSASILTGPSSCRGGAANRTGYWTPAVIDAAGKVVLPDEAVIYYKTGYNMPPAKTQVLPAGLRMIAGDKNALGAQQAPGPLDITKWMCVNSGKESITIPTCAAGDTVRLAVYFPSCWDGKRLDSPDHKSHMAYPNFAKGVCPSTHPVQVPQISEHFDYPVPKGVNSSTWRLSSDMYDPKLGGGLSAHADWMMAWDSATMKALVENCLQKALDCGVGGIGGNRSLY